MTMKEDERKQTIIDHDEIWKIKNSKQVKEKIPPQGDSDQKQKKF